MNWPEDFTNKIICKGCLEVMKQIPDECVDIVMTSPPYWGLRDYGIEQVFGGDKDCGHKWDKKIKKWHSDRGSGPRKEVFDDSFQIKGTRDDICIKCGAWKGQLGLEPTPEMYIEHLTDIFNEAKRVLKKEGTLWLNIGDTYWSAKGSCYNPGGGKNSIETPRKENNVYPLYRGNKSDVPNLSPKCLTMIPERLAWSLIQNGWILRNKIIWYKPNSMPSSVKDRFSNKWEYLFLFSKDRKYYFNLDAVREEPKWDIVWSRKGSGKDTPWEQNNPRARWGRTRKEAEENGASILGKNPGDVVEIPAETRTLGAILGYGKAVKVPGGKGWVGHPKGGGAACQKDPRWCPPEGPNPGDFLEINTQPFPEAHFAVFPEKLCERPLKAACPEQVCKRCGKARERVSKPKFTKHNGKTETSYNKKITSAGRLALLRQKARESGREYINERTYLGWTFCNCNAGFEPGIVLDPLCGSGTVGVMAKKLGRQFILIDIKKEYCEMAEKRIAQSGYQMELRI